MVLEYRVEWAGVPVEGPGISVLHARISGGATGSSAAQSFADRARTLFDGLKTLVPVGITWTFPAEVVELDTSTGALVSVYAVTPPADVLSSGSASSYSRPSGLRLDWTTPAIVAGRRLKGRTFIVPIIGGGYDGSGTLSATTITAAQTAATAYINPSVFANAQPSIWSRTHGVQADISSADVPDEAAVLRSRRD